MGEPNTFVGRTCTRTGTPSPSLTRGPLRPLLPVVPLSKSVVGEWWVSIRAMPSWKVWLACLALSLLALIGAVVGNWLWVKTKFALRMEAIGVNWTNSQQVSDGDKMNFAVGAGLNFFAVVLTAVGVWLALEQRWAAQREEQRKAVLKVVLPNPPSHSGDRPDRYQLYWSLVLRRAVRKRSRIGGHWKPLAGCQCVDHVHWRYQDWSVARRSCEAVNYLANIREEDRWRIHPAEVFQLRLRACRRVHSEATSRLYLNRVGLLRWFSR